MKIPSFLSTLLLCLPLTGIAQVNLKDPIKSYHIGIGLYPITYYELGHAVKWNILITKGTHDFYAGFSTHINHDHERWSNTGNVFRGTGIAQKFGHYFHPDFGYTKYIKLARGYPVSFIINPDFQFGKTYRDTKWYIYNPNYNSSSDINDGTSRILNDGVSKNESFRYWQFSLNMGLKVDFSKRLQMNSKVGFGLAHISEDYDATTFLEVNTFEFPIVYSVGLNYIFR